VFPNLSTIGVRDLTS